MFADLTRIRVMLVILLQLVVLSGWTIMVDPELDPELFLNSFVVDLVVISTSLSRTIKNTGDNGSIHFLNL